MPKNNKGYWFDNALCPFFKGNSQKVINCENFLDDEAYISIGFHSNEGRDQQLALFCCADYEKCEFFRMIKEAEGE